MKLKTLLIVVAVLAAASAAVYLVNRPEAPAPADPRVGQALLPPATLEQAAKLTLSESGNTVELAKAGDGQWQVASFHDLPADFGKLSRFVQELTDAKVDRFVTANPQRLERLEFKDTRIALADASGNELWAITLGKTAEGGGRFIRFGDEAKGFRTRLNAWLDTTARNWADSSLLALKPEQVAKVEIDFEAGAPLVLTREKAEDAFSAAEAPADQTVRKPTVDSLLSTLTNLRFIDTSDASAADVAAAREHQRNVTLTTFDGQTVRIALGRKPEETIVKPAEPKPEESGPAAIVGSVNEAPKPDEAGPAAATAGTTETIPAGPVFAFVEGPSALAKLADAPESLAFKVSDYTFTSLSKARADLLETKPAEPAPADVPAAPPAEASADDPATAASAASDAAPEPANVDAPNDTP